jgi:hypothetical protein
MQDIFHPHLGGSGSQILYMYEYYLMINPYEVQLLDCCSRMTKLYETIITIDTTINRTDNYQRKFVTEFKKAYGEIFIFKMLINAYLIEINNKRNDDNAFDEEILAIKQIISTKREHIRVFKEDTYEKINTYNFSYGDGYYEKIKILSSGVGSVSSPFDYSRLMNDKNVLEIFKESLVSKEESELNDIINININNVNSNISLIKKNILYVIDIDNSYKSAEDVYKKDNSTYLNYLYPYINYLLKTIENLQESYKSMYLLEKTLENINGTTSSMPEIIKLFTVST